MIVVTLLVSDHQVGRVRNAAVTPQCILRTASVTEARTLLRQQPADVLVLDPVVGNDAPRVASSATELFTLGIEFPYLPIVFYVSRPAKALSLIARFPSRERCEAVVVGVDDAPTAIAVAIDSVVSSSLAARLVRQLAPEIAEAPPSFLRALRHLFANPTHFRTVDDVAHESCMCRRTFDRWLARCGSVSGAALLHTARGFFAARRQRDTGSAPREVRRMSAIHGSAAADMSDGVAGGAALSYSQVLNLTDDEMTAWFAGRARRLPVNER